MLQFKITVVKMINVRLQRHLFAHIVTVTVYNHLHEMFHIYYINKIRRRRWCDDKYTFRMAKCVT